MVAQLLVNKPSRSDEVLGPDQQLKITEQVRAQIESMVPKRPIKPNRSEPDFAPPPSGTPFVDGIIPELDKFRSLQSQSQAVFSTENGMVQEDFTETQYYNLLESIDKQHHTTGTGFIKVVGEGAENGSHYEFPRTADNGGERNMGFSGYRSNPATNDWIPSFDDHQVIA
ncbi:hypothetical protein Ancab_025949 [Ancistrocladus abbreviatus]